MGKSKSVMKLIESGVMECQVCKWRVLVGTIRDSGECVNGCTLKDLREDKESYYHPNRVPKPEANYYHLIGKMLRMADGCGDDSFLSLSISKAPGGKEADDVYGKLMEAIETTGIPANSKEYDHELLELLDLRGEAGFNVGYALGKFGLEAFFTPGSKI